MSVDTYARKKDFSRYRSVDVEGGKLLVSQSLARQAAYVQLELRKFLMFRWFNVRAGLYGHET